MQKLCQNKVLKKKKNVLADSFISEYFSSLNEDNYLMLICISFSQAHTWQSVNAGGPPRSRRKSYDCVKCFFIFLNSSQSARRRLSNKTADRQKKKKKKKSDGPRLLFDNSECSQFAAACACVCVYG